MSLRAIICVTNGNVEASFWTEAARAEPPIKGKPLGCAGCPLRVGGEWAGSAERVIERATPSDRATLKRWGCHKAPRPCAGMRRILAGGRT
jgi:hypothetical protein